MDDRVNNVNLSYQKIISNNNNMTPARENQTQNNFAPNIEKYLMMIIF